MLYRKIRKKIENFLDESPNKVLIVEGARQIGKTYIIRQVGNDKFPNFIEINMAEDKIKNREFENVRSVEDFYLKVSSFAGEKMKNKNPIHILNNILFFSVHRKNYPDCI